MPTQSIQQNNYSVYIHTNKLNGKKYIGITRQDPRRRWQNGFGYENTYFGKAVKKYGWDGFFHEVIAFGLTKQQACDMEIALIALHRTNNRCFGYNISDGGNTCDVLQGKSGEDHPNHQRVKMIDKDTKEVLRIFGAQSEAARIMGINRKGITKACLGIVATYKGYIWEYVDKDCKKPEHNGAGNYYHSKIMKKVIITFPNGTIKEYLSKNDACSDLNVPKNSAWRYLKNNSSDQCGRRWCYA